MLIPWLKVHLYVILRYFAEQLKYNLNRLRKMPTARQYVLPRPPEGQYPALKDPWQRFWSPQITPNKTRAYFVSNS